MSELQRTFKLNTAVTGLSEYGKFDEKVHSSRVQPLRGFIMNNDGMTGCFIERYAITVKFLDTVTDLETVKRIVLDAVKRAAQLPDLFPLRSDKTPQATYDVPSSEKPKDPNDPKWVVINFASHLTRFFPTADGSFDMEAFREATSTLAEELTDQEGVVDFELFRTHVGLKFDPRFTTRDEVLQRLINVLTALRHNFFPYAEDEDIDSLLKVRPEA